MNIDTTGAHPSMDYPAHFSTYRSFVTAAVWLSIAVAMILILMAAFLV